MRTSRLLPLLAVLVIGCTGTPPQPGPIDDQSASPTTTPSRPPATPDTGSVADSLGEIVVARTAPPTGTEFFQSFDGASSGTQMVQDKPSDVRSAVLDGFVDGLTREFASRETAAVIRGDASPNDLSPADHHFVGSLALAYKDAPEAQAALEVFKDALRPDYSSEDELALGEHGALFRGEFLGVPSLHYLWQDGAFVMAVASNGMVEDEIRGLAEGMQARVPASGSDAALPAARGYAMLADLPGQPWGRASGWSHPSWPAQPVGHVDIRA